MDGHAAKSALKAVLVVKVLVVSTVAVVVGGTAGMAVVVEGAAGIAVVVGTTAGMAVVVVVAARVEVVGMFGPGTGQIQGFQENASEISAADRETLCIQILAICQKMHPMAI